MPCQNSAMTTLPAGRSARLRPGPRLLAAVVAGLVLVGACGQTPTPSPAASSNPSPASTAGVSASATPSPGPTQDAAALYSLIEDQVIAERGLPAKQHLVPTILSEAEVKTRIQAEFAKDNPPGEIATSEQTLKALGLLPPDASLGTLYVDMLGSQVAGFYDPKAKAMFVVSKSGSVGATERATFAHEFTHALQDQNFGLEGIDVDAVGQGDRSLARLALVEGDATLAMARWMSRNMGPAEMAELLNVDPEAQAQLAKMPAILRDTLLFPYQQGLAFVNGLAASGGWEAVNRAFSRLPDSTEQVLHPEKYQAGEKPLDVKLDGPALAKAMGAGWTDTPADTLGEFQLSTWLRENGVAAGDAQAAAAGWGGDRYVYLRGPHGAYALALLTEWDTPSDADAFLAAARTAAAHLPGAAEARVAPGSGTDRSAGSVAVLVASDAATLAALQTAAASPPR